MIFPTDMKDKIDHQEFNATKADTKEYILYFHGGPTKPFYATHMLVIAKKNSLFLSLKSILTERAVRKYCLLCLIYIYISIYTYISI